MGNGTRALPRGTVTAMFTDIVDSTKLKPMMGGGTDARRDREFRSTIKQPHDKVVCDLVSRHDGQKVKSTGDGFLFTFADAAEALLCALAIQGALRARPIVTPVGPLQLRIGIHTGHVDGIGEDYTATTVDKAKRVQTHAGPGEVLVSAETRILIGDLRKVSFQSLTDIDLKGLGTTTLFRALAPPADSTTGADTVEWENPYDFARIATATTYKGRATEMEELLDSIETATHAAIFGLQRMGKTSLIRQGLRAELDGRPTLRDRVLLATIDMQRLGGDQVKYRDFVTAIVEAIIGQLTALSVGREVQNLRTYMRDLLTNRGDRTEFFAAIAHLLSELARLAKRRIVLFIDEFSEIRKVIERNKAALRNNPGRTANLLPHDMYIDVPFVHHLSSLLKDESLKEKITFIVLVRPFIAEYDEREDLQLFKLMNSITLRRLDDEPARELITKPLESHVSYDDDAVEHLLHITAGHPYLLQFILNTVINKIRRTERRTVMLDDVKAVQERMVSNGPAFDAQFEVLISDYSVDEIMHPKETLLGKGMLALISKFGQEHEGWVSAPEIFERFAKYKIPEEKTSSLLSQLTRTQILEEGAVDEIMQYRLSIPLLQERFVRQNLYRKYFRLAN